MLQLSELLEQYSKGLSGGRIMFRKLQSQGPLAVAEILQRGCPQSHLEITGVILVEYSCMTSIPRKLIGRFLFEDGKHIFEVSFLSILGLIGYIK